MSTLQQIRQDLTQVWDHLRGGWQRLADQAAGAVTRFTQGGRDASGGRPADRRGIWASPGHGALRTGEGWASWRRRSSTRTTGCWSGWRPPG